MQITLIGDGRVLVCEQLPQVRQEGVVVGAAVEVELFDGSAGVEFAHVGNPPVAEGETDGQLGGNSSGSDDATCNLAVRCSSPMARSAMRSRTPAASRPA